MESIQRLFTHRILTTTPKCIPLRPISRTPILTRPTSFSRIPTFITPTRNHRTISAARSGWFLGMGQKKKNPLPEIVKAGDPVLHEPAQEVRPDFIGSERIQKIVDDMVMVMRAAPGVGLAAPQIGIPLRIIVLEDKQEYIDYAPKDELKLQDRRAFDLLCRL